MATIMKTKIHLEDNGQDFLAFIVNEVGVVDMLIRQVRKNQAESSKGVSNEH